MKNYQKYINALRKCAKEHENDWTPTFNTVVSFLCKDTADLLEELQQEKNVDLDELKRKILMEVDGGTDDKWLRYSDICKRISDSIDEYKTDRT